MKRIPWPQIGFILSVLLASWAEPVWPQSQNRQAMTWFEAGLREAEAQKKIDAYTKACELDPSFVEALFNLGMAYEEKKDYVRAEEYIRRAYNVKPDKLESALKFKIVYALANVYNKLSKNDNYERTLQQAKALANNQETLARLSFELGRLMYQQRRYEEASAELKEGRRHVTKDRENYDTLMLLAEKAARLEKLYATAEREKAGGRLKEARSIFGQIAAENPDFRHVKAQIAELDSLLKIANEKAAFAGIYEQAQKYEVEEKLELAISAYENLLRQAGNYSDAETRLQSLKQKLEHAQRLEKLENTYADGNTALRLRDWENAIISFENVLALDPGFGEARKKLSQARRAFEREGAETLVARYYADGVTAMQRNDIGGALAAFEKVRKLSPNYRDVAGRLAQIEKALAPEPKTVAKAAARPINLDSLYQLALAAEQHGDWKRAVLTLEEIHFYEADYRDINARLLEARAYMNQSASTGTVAPSSPRNHTPIYLAGIVGAMVVLSIIVFLPANHARWHLLRRNYTAAASVYEKLVARHPRRLKFYPPLADIYLLLGREDDSALKIYRTVLQLNLPSHNYDRINAIVAKKFLNERRADTDAIEVLQRALKNEQQSKSSINAKG